MFDWFKKTPAPVLETAYVFKFKPERDITAPELADIIASTRYLDGIGENGETLVLMADMNSFKADPVYRHFDCVEIRDIDPAAHA
jgi:hypothetical protein